MNSRELAAYCASRPAAVEDHPWGASPTVFKVGGLDGPLFAIVSNDADPPQISLRCDPDLAEALRRAHPDGSIPHAELRSMVDHSWEQVVAGMPRSRRPA